MTNPRVLPLTPDELNADQRRFMAPFTDRKGRYSNIFGVLGRNLPLMDAWLNFGLYTMQGSRLETAAREVLILRVARNTGCDYERHHHERIGVAAGLSLDVMQAIADDGLIEEPSQQLMLRCADDLADEGRLSDTTWDAMIASLGLEATLDAIFTVGAYTALSMGLKSCDVQIERIPKPA